MKFEYNPRILEQLGTELITSDEVAFTELLKNSYDARAKDVNVHFLDNIDQINHSKLLIPINENLFAKVKGVIGDNRLIIIEDNGTGMSKKTLKEGFFTVGSDLKKSLKEAEAKISRADKITLGDKGLGRLASQRLGPILIVETSTNNNDEKKIHFVEIEWINFFNDLDQDAPEAEFEKVSSQSYTRLWFVEDKGFDRFIDDKRPEQLGLFSNSEDDDDDVIVLQEGLQSSVSFLYSPFEKIEEQFNINFYLNGKRVKSSFHNESIQIAQSIHRFTLKEKDGKKTLNIELELKPWYIELLHLRVLGKNLFQRGRKSSEFYISLLEKYKDRIDRNLKKEYFLDEFMEKEMDGKNRLFKSSIEKITPISSEVYSFHREAFRLNLLVEGAKNQSLIPKGENIKSIRNFLNFHNGIKLYRDKFRIANLGDKDSDWLNLQQARTRGQQFFRFELGNVIGYVKLNDFYQRYIKEISSRQELKQNEYSIALKWFLQRIFNHDFYNLSTTAYYLIRDILYEEDLIPKNTPKELKEQVNESEKLLKQTLVDLEKFKSGFEVISSNINLDSQEKIKAVQKIIAELDPTNYGLSNSLTSSISTLKAAKDTLVIIEERQKESYNNYKLMANGLITEVMTHELHSILLNTRSGTNYTTYVEALKSYLLDMKEIGLYKDNLKPVSERLDFLHTRIEELDLFYNFLEKTFIKQGTSNEFVKENIFEFTSDFQFRFSKRLKKLNTNLNFIGPNNYTWFIPKGSLTHVLYNLIDNSLYWIGERQKKSAYDNTYKRNEHDRITIEKIDELTLHYYDSGIGVSPDMQDVLFHPFQSGKKEGRGMGMYIVKKLLESFGGNIILLPEENMYGNRFIFSLVIGDNPNE
ncbi:ATP-binding protein [Algoriphagus marinus]|uniref:ATP-binding protein n=1 Tax=Algoriphagus marinus TaxID=1925762 RepID=UPI00094BBA06|nr:ATP-binding protein [Algoriphagus marinus]